MHSLPSSTISSGNYKKPLELFQQPLSKQVFNRVADNLDHLVANFAYKVRFMQREISKLTQLEVDEAYLDGLREKDAHAAYKAYAWFRTCNPFELGARQHTVNTDRLVEVFFEHPDYLYRYGLFFAGDPNKCILDKLAGLHGPTSGLYFNHCVLQRVAEVEGYDLKMLTNW